MSEVITMKLVTRKKVRLEAVVETVSAPAPKEKKHKKEHVNTLPPDEYKDLLEPVEIPLNDSGKLVISVKRGGEFGLPTVDIRFFATTEVYTGFTKKGVNIYLNKLPELKSALCDIIEDCDKENLFEEFKD